MLEITRRNCYKSDLETIINNDSQYFWINLRDFEAETESKWLNIFNEHGNASNIKFQPDRIFIRNDLFERIIKSCKATNAELLTLKKKLGICPYEENYYGEEIIKIKDDIEESFNKLLDESEEEFFKELDKELGKGLNKKLNKETSDEELIEIINPKKEQI